MAGHDAAPLYQSGFQESDMVWLADEYQRRSASEPSLTLEAFAKQYSVPLDDLLSYLPELSGERGYSIVVWHGTSQSRAKSILKEGFRPKVKKGEERRIFFTQKPAVAREYARKRGKNESDGPAVIQCAINLNEYQDYQRRGEGVFAFKAERISSDVIRRVSGHKREPRKKPEKRKYANVESSGVALTYNSGPAAIAYWINNYLALNDHRRIPENHQAVEGIKQWLDEQIEQGMFGEAPHTEIREQVTTRLPEYLS